MSAGLLLQHAAKGSVFVNSRNGGNLKLGPLTALQFSLQAQASYEAAGDQDKLSQMQDENRRILNKVTRHHFLDTDTVLMYAFVFFFFSMFKPGDLVAIAGPDRKARQRLTSVSTRSLRSSLLLASLEWSDTKVYEP